MKSNHDPAEKVAMTALADLWERDIAELKRTKQPGWEAACRELEKAIGELRESLQTSAGLDTSLLRDGSRTSAFLA